LKTIGRGRGNAVYRFRSRGEYRTAFVHWRRPSPTYLATSGQSNRRGLAVGALLILKNIRLTIGQPDGAGNADCAGVVATSVGAGELARSGVQHDIDLSHVDGLLGAIGIVVVAYVVQLAGAVGIGRCGHSFHGSSDAVHIRVNVASEVIQGAAEVIAVAVFDKDAGSQHAIFAVIVINAAVGV